MTLKGFIYLILVFLGMAGVVQNVPETAVGGELVIHFIDVGQADAAVILCDGEVLMIDGGNAEDSSLIYSYLRNTLGLSHIDYMIATHPHEDHIGGLSGALNACSVGTIYSPVTEYDSKVFANLQKYAAMQGFELTVPSMGQNFTLGTANVQFLSPAKAYQEVNDLSIAVRIAYGNTSFLFTGDAEWEAEHDMIDSGWRMDATLLKVGHHGSSTSSSYVFLREVMPQYAVISVGSGNSYGHPSAETLSRLRDVGAQVFRTDQQGHIVVRSDGHKLNFSIQKSWLQEKSSTVQQTDEEYVPAQPNAALYVGNRKSMKFHYASCSGAVDMKVENRVDLPSREVALAEGYEPCGACKP